MKILLLVLLLGLLALGGHFALIADRSDAQTPGRFVRVDAYKVVGRVFYLVQDEIFGTCYLVVSGLRESSVIEAPCTPRP
jgi:hypothetical protein